MPNARLFLTSYAFAAERIYTVQIFGDAPTEPAVFTRFARSFALIDPEAAAPRRAFSERGVVACAYFSALVVFLALGGFVNALAKRPMISGGLLAFLTILIIATLRMAGVVATNPSGERIGSVLGEAALPAIIAAWAHSRHTSKKKQASAARSPQ